MEEIFPEIYPEEEEGGRRMKKGEGGNTEK